ncbi:hypothetical protein GCM10022204_31000 [Microlunatus aurantiacus]|uniref:Uncharacterized protein n=1 Tax=Microlunatus aurantiacus TaxID=446786 RepID=A0ABP7DWC6_9ACTN
MLRVTLGPATAWAASSDAGAGDSVGPGTVMESPLPCAPVVSSGLGEAASDEGSADSGSDWWGDGEAAGESGGSDAGGVDDAGPDGSVGDAVGSVGVLRGLGDEVAACLGSGVGVASANAAAGSVMSPTVATADARPASRRLGGDEVDTEDS